MSVLFAVVLAAQDAPRLELRKGDHVCIVGNTLAERMQHDGWLETLLHSRFPEHDLTIRNLGFSGDELELRLRSAGFGSPDEHLTIQKADVILAFFGYNESFGEKLRQDLEKAIDHWRSQKYNGREAPRLAVFSPIAHENLKDPNLPDGAAATARLEAAARVMAEVARAKGVPFVDLLAPSRKLYAEAPAPLTINGIHMTEKGNERLAAAIDEGLFGPAPSRPSQYLDRLRGAVVDKSFHWFHRHRTTDGFSTYGGRADLKFVDGQTNRVVLQRELEILDAMAALRDRRIWEAARGAEPKPVDDASTPAPVPVISNKPGPHNFLSGEESIARMTPGPDLKVNLFASEERFPELVNPVQMAFDTRGRLWVAVWPNYPHWNPKDKMSDKLLILEDTDGDGRADRSTAFVDDLNNPTGFEFWGGGVLVAAAPDLLFLKDTNGDGKADVRERLLHGLDSADTHHQANSFVLDPGGALYFQEGTFHHTQVESPWGPPVRLANAGVFRYEPRTHRFGVYVSFGFANPHGHVFDRWGQDFVTDGTTEETYYALSFSGRVDFPRKHPKPPRIFQQRTRPCAGTEILSSRHFPEANQGNLLLANVIGVLGILQYKVADAGSGFAATEVEPIVLSSDPNFRPSDIEIGPEGALYFTDWHNPIIGHMQHNLRDPSRDRAHGRVYRVTHASRPLVKPAPIVGAPVGALLELLKDTDDRVRCRTRIELSGRPTADVLAAARPWTAKLTDPHDLLEALWLHQSHNVVDEPLLRKMLRSPEPRARAAATRVLRAWADRVPDTLALLKVQAADEHPRVRLEAVVAASDLRDPRAAEAALECLKHPLDPFLEFGLKETMQTLEPLWKPALAEGKLTIAADNPGAAEYLLGNVGTAELSKLPRTPAVCLALLTRHGVAAPLRAEAVSTLAKLRQVDEVTVLLDVVQNGADGAHAAHVAADWAALLGKLDLKAARPRLEALALKGASVPARRVGWALWTAADGSADAAFAAASKNPAALREFVEAIPMIADEKLRGALWPKLRPLLKGDGGPQPLPVPGVRVDYFERTPANAALETLAKLSPDASGTAPEISLKAPQIRRRDEFALRFSGTLAVAKAGKYVFFTESDDGSRLYIDGKQVVENDGPHGMSEKKGEIQLTEGAHAIVVTYYDSGGGDGLEVSWQGPSLKKERIPALALTVEATDALPDAVIRALESVPGNEAGKFAELAALAAAGRNRSTVFRALRLIPRASWPREQAKPLVTSILGFASALPTEQRTMPHVIDALKLGGDLAELLPKAQADQARAMLKDLDVRVIVIRPVPHQMLFDLKRLRVVAGKPVVILFDNVDIMPHNLVVTAPGSLALVGDLAEKMGNAGPARDYVPESPKVLWATRMLLPGQSQQLAFTAPKETGKYPYLCTFPGHWLVMNGVMEVVAEGSAPELAETSAEAPAAARAFVKLWTTEDLEADVAKGLKGRSFEKGKAAFVVAGCNKCHAIAGEGGKVGPDLSKVADKFKGKELLRQVIDPSSAIDEAFKTHLIELKDESFVAGLVTAETGAELRVLTNPQDPADLTVVKKADIANRRTSPVSTMPTGLLSTLSKDEILDLLAYLEAGGDPKHGFYR